MVRLHISSRPQDTQQAIIKKNTIRNSLVTEGMHYIRLLRPPAIEQVGPKRTLKVVLTITTDLGDSFLSMPEPVELSVLGINTALTEGLHTLVPVPLAGRERIVWRPGHRVLKLELPLPANPITTIQIRPAAKQLAALSTDAIFSGDHGLVVPVYADLPTHGRDVSHVSFRSIRISSRVASVEALVQVEEDIGESIARHIWDAGMAAVSLFSYLSLRSSTADRMKALLTIMEERHPVSILELGCGVRYPRHRHCAHSEMPARQRPWSCVDDRPP